MGGERESQVTENGHERHRGVLQCVSQRVAVIWCQRPGPWLEFPVFVSGLVRDIRRLLRMADLHLV
jgi:hypothetical protein